MDYEDRSDHDRRRIAKRIAELEKMLRSLQHTKRSTKRVHNIALSSEASSNEVSTVAAMALSET
jgi:hypothetical protein